MTDDTQTRDGEPLDPRIRAWADEYQRPGPPRKEAMWAAIRTARGRREAEVVALRPRGPRRPPRWLAWSAAAAAVLVLGIAIGRMTSGPPGPAAPTEGGAPLAAGPEPAPNGENDSRRVAVGLATTQHLTRAEFLLTNFRLATGEAQFAGPARELLLSTRLLLDSPVVQDSATRVLLQDLEVILVQIVQLPPDDRGEERELITEGLEERQVLPRIRTAVPAGPSRPTGVS